MSGEGCKAVGACRGRWRAERRVQLPPVTEPGHRPALLSLAQETAPEATAATRARDKSYSLTGAVLTGRTVRSRYGVVMAWLGRTACLEQV
jgi:hypothetical protein